MGTPITWAALAVSLAGCAGGGLQSTATSSPVLARTASHEIRIESGRCEQANQHTCMPEDDYGVRHTLIVHFQPLKTGGACPVRISDVMAWEKKTSGAHARPLGLEHAASPPDGCGFRVCFSVGDSSLIGHTGPREIALTWLQDGQRERLPQPLLLSKAAHGRFAVEFKTGQNGTFSQAGAEAAAPVIR